MNVFNTTSLSFKMRASSLGLFWCLAAVGTCDPTVDRTFVRVALEDPPNWFANALLTARIIDGFSEVYNQSTADAWAQSVVDKCNANALCTSSISLSGTWSCRSNIEGRHVIFGHRLTTTHFSGQFWDR